MKKITKPKEDKKQKDYSEKKEEISEMNEEQLLEKNFGIKDFETTKNKSHVDSDLSAVFKPSKVKRKYRQYMNRKGINKSSDML